MPNEKLVSKCNPANEKGFRMARRRYQRGQLIRKGDRWIARWREDVANAEGVVNRIQRRRELGSIAEYPTKRLAQRALDELLRDINSLTSAPTHQITFAAFAKRWREKVMVLHEPSTQSSERSMLKSQIEPAFGHLMLGSIRLEQVQDFVTSADCSPKTVRNLVSLLMTMWDTALGWEYVQHHPFPRGVNGKLLLKLPKRRKPKTYNFTVDESLAIIGKAKDRWKVFFRLLAESGMRPGEAAGLRRRDVDGRTIRVEQSIWRNLVKAPKTPTGVRQFLIGADLAGQLQRSTAKLGDNDLIFANRAGAPLSQDNFRKRVLNPILESLGIRRKLENLGIKRCGNYAFRHMNATLMDRLGTPLKTRQQRLGHAQIETTMGYTHAEDGADLVVADQIGALLKERGENERLQ